MASSKLFLAVMFFLLIASNVAWDENANNDEEDVVVRNEVDSLEGDEGSSEPGAKKKNMESRGTTGTTIRNDNSKKEQVDPNMDGLILLACMIGLVLCIVLLRYVCCTIEQCEEKNRKSLAAKDKVEHTKKEIVLQGMKYKSLV